MPQIDLAAALAEQKPAIDLHLDAYEASTRHFLAAVSNYTHRAVAESSCEHSRTSLALLDLTAALLPLSHRLGLGADDAL